ncbi:MAG: MBOAT family protein, partial [Deltaproteobacteria bacterium]|nr:MBOAT family protein [Deltaproteobacteria bacterium]
MLFNQIEFIVLIIVIAAIFILIRENRHRKLILLVSSYYFYAYWDWRFLGLILFSTIVDYFVAILIAKNETEKVRKIFLIISLTSNLGLLGFFKYFNFFIDSLKVALGPLDVNLTTLNIILPVGISFYTFQTLSYTIDVYRRKLNPCYKFTDFALYVSFFPQLVAGPIVRASDFLPQLTTPNKITLERVYGGFRQFVFGLFKKVFIADRIAYFVDHVFSNYDVYNGVTIWLAVIAFAIQIYCDFSGYSDMAIGIARGLGYDFPENFRLPYISRSIIEFWRRWHISLSSWLRDYLYIPLGGSRKGSLRTYINLSITMVLGGLWHGAAWNFIIWGAIQGIALMINRWFVENVTFSLPLPSKLKDILGWFVTMNIVLISWVFFRSTDYGLGQSLGILKKIFLSPLTGISWIHPFVLLTIGL